MKNARVTNDSVVSTCARRAPPPQDALRTMAKDLKVKEAKRRNKGATGGSDNATGGDGEAITATELGGFIERARHGDVGNNDIQRFAKVFGDEFLLDNISRPELVNMCQVPRGRGDVHTHTHTHTSYVSIAISVSRSTYGRGWAPSVRCCRIRMLRRVSPSDVASVPSFTHLHHTHKLTEYPRRRAAGRRRFGVVSCTASS